MSSTGGTIVRRGCRSFEIFRERFIQKFRAQVIVERKSVPVRRFDVLHVIGETGIGQEYGGHLLPISVPHADSPTAPSSAAFAAPLKKGNLVDWTHLSKFLG